MQRQPRVKKPSPPEWWSPTLYDYLKDLPLDGWVWEFMRRARLKMLRPRRHVDAMKPGGEKKLSRWSDYYIPGLKIPKEGKFLFAPSAVYWKGITHGGWYRPSPHNVDDFEVEDETSGRDPRLEDQWVDIRINLKRRDAVILQDFKSALSRARKTFREPRRVNPRDDDWIQNQILEVWDLREFKVPWKQIVDLPGMFENKARDHPEYDVIQSARNAYSTARRLIEERGWQRLALQEVNILLDGRRTP
jgi:hypothetical protein